MIGRVYRWRGELWRVVARGDPFDRGPRRNVLIERLVPWLDVVERGTVATLSAGWLVCRAGRFPLVRVGERGFVPTGERVVRPFRGLRRAGGDR